MSGKFSRDIEEKKENLPSAANTGASDLKYQENQQTQNTAAAEKTTVPKSSFDLEKKKTHGNTLKQEVISKIVENGSYSGSGAQSTDGGLRSFRGVSGSVDGGILGASNATPNAAQSRKETRYGKKLDRVGNHINYLPSEQVLVEYDEPAPLAEAKDETIGYNGTYRNEFSRSQKSHGSVPGSLMFDRSADLIIRDELYFGQGQQIKQNNDYGKYAPTISAEIGADGGYAYPQSTNYKVHRGNYLHEKCHITVGPDGKTSSMGFDVEDLSVEADKEVVNKSSSFRLVDMNYAELNRETMDDKAGDEKADIWTPLARAVAQPTQVSGYLRDLEAMTGNEVYINYVKAGLSMAYQLNRSRKDGQNTIRPAIEAILGLFNEETESTAFDSASLNTIFDVANYSKGAASIFIAMYDTVKKYNTKADLLLQPRSFRMALQTADNNMSPLKVSKVFVDYFKNRECFSTIDRDYDSMLPVCMTDKSAIITSYNYNELYGFITGTHEVGYNGSTSSKVINVFAPRAISAFDVLEIWVSDSNAVTDALSGSVPSLTITDAVKVKFFNEAQDSVQGYTKLITLHSYDSKFINIESHGLAFSGKITNYYNHGDKVFGKGYGPYYYKYSDLRNNYVMRVAFPLLEGLSDYIDNGGGAMLSKKDVLGFCPAISIPMVQSTQYYSLWSFLLCMATPYIISARINSMRDIIYYEDNVHEYPFNQLESIGNVSTKDFRNFRYTDYDTPIEMGVMNPVTAMSWELPEFFWNIPNSNIIKCSSHPDHSAKTESKVLLANDTGADFEGYIYGATQNVTLTLNPSALSDDELSAAVVDDLHAGYFEVYATNGATEPKTGYSLIGHCEVKNGKAIKLVNAASNKLFFNTVVSSVLPWYFSENSLKMNEDGKYVEDDDADNISIPCIRSGARLAFLDNVYGISLKDLLLSLDRITSLKSLSLVDLPSASGVYKYGLTTDGQPYITIDKSASNYLDGSSTVDFLKLPRMIGLGLVAPGGLLSTLSNGYKSIDGYLTSTCYRLKYFTNEDISRQYYGSNGNVNAKDDVNIKRAANFTQVWHQAFADGISTHDDYDYGMIFGASELFTPQGDNNEDVQVKRGASLFSPFVNLVNQEEQSLNVVSLQKAFWTRIQKLPFVISPFDAYSKIGNTGNCVDIYDLAYIFGLAGFRAADYREEVYNREKQVVNQGRLFVLDPWVEHTPLLSGSAESGNSKAVGYKF